MLRIDRRWTLAAALTLVLTACAQTDTADDAADETASPEPTMTMEADATESPQADASDDDDDATSDDDDASSSDDPSRESAMTIEELITEPETFLGQEIYVIGEIAEEVGDEHAFTMAGLAETDALLVVNEGDEVFQEIDPTDSVMVQGTLVEFDAEAMADAGAELTPDDDAVSDYDGEHVLVADDVEQIDED